MIYVQDDKYANNLDFSIIQHMHELKHDIYPMYNFVLIIFLVCKIHVNFWSFWSQNLLQKNRVKIALSYDKIY